MATRKNNSKVIISAEISESLDSKSADSGAEVKKVIKKAKVQSKNIKDKVLTMVPTMTKGNHLTVWTFPDSSTKLEWDDEALLKEVKDAILSAELAAMKPAVRAKAATRRKKESNV